MSPFSLTFFVAGEPKGQPRFKAFSRKIKCKQCSGFGKIAGVDCNGCGGTGNAYVAGVYDPGVANEWKHRIAFEVKKSLPATPLAGALAVGIKFLLPRPKSAMRKCDPAGLMPSIHKPDLDNLEKAVLDILTQMALWQDDAQICVLETSKSYHEKDGRPGAWITVRELEV